MADIELVIKISPKIYEYVQHMGSIPMLDTQQVANAIFDGTPLPEGHGDLVDISKLDGEWVCTRDGNYECVKECSCENCEYSEYQYYTDIRDLPVIIKADKEGKDADSN